MSGLCFQTTRFFALDGPLGGGGWEEGGHFSIFVCGWPSLREVFLSVYGPRRSGPFEIPKERNISGLLVNSCSRPKDLPKIP